MRKMLKHETVDKLLPEKILLDLVVFMGTHNNELRNTNVNTIYSAK